MKLSLDIRTVTDIDGTRGLRVWPEITGTTNHKNAVAIIVLVMLTIASLYAIAQTPDVDTHPTITILGGR